ncbi:MAG: MgtC/SapB family protein [Chloroflexi bacterium]|nr:MgtC/SapB family protein [Chloroflexota bacterium]
MERELAGREAGDRTFSLVTMGTALFTGVSMVVFGQVDPDPATRVIANILTGVGFLGAGMIVRGAGGVRGLTTAAGIWVMAAVGMAVGLGLYLVAGLTSVVVFVVFRSKQILDVRRMREPSS